MFSYKRRKTVKEFIHMKINKAASDLIVKQDRGILLRNVFLARIDSPATNRETDTLKQVIVSVAGTKSSLSFLVNDSRQAVGVVTSH